MSTLKIKRENGKIFCPLADSWHIETPEEKVRQEYNGMGKVSKYRCFG